MTESAFIIKMMTFQYLIFKLLVVTNWGTDFNYLFQEGLVLTDLQMNTVSRKFLVTNITHQNNAFDCPANF